MNWVMVEERKEWNAYLKIEPDIEQALEACVRTGELTVQRTRNEERTFWRHAVRPYEILWSPFQWKHPYQHLFLNSAGDTKVA